MVDNTGMALTHMIDCLMQANLTARMEILPPVGKVIRLQLLAFSQKSNTQVSCFELVVKVKTIKYSKVNRKSDLVSFLENRTKLH